MFRTFSGKTADETWLQVVEALRHEPHAPVQPSRAGPTQEILHAAIAVENSSARWVISRHPAINPAYAFAELIWTVNGREDSAFLTYFNSKLPEMAGDGTTFHGAYGKRLRKHLGFDQFARAYQALKCNPDSRQVVLQIWDGRIDLPNEKGQPVSPDIPCNLVSLLKVRACRLEWTQVMRSNDIFRGIPYDFVQFTCLQEIIAGWLGVKPGAYCHVSDSLHVYLKDLPNVLAAAPVIPLVDTSSLALPFAESEEVFRTLAHAIDCIIDASHPAAELLALLQASALPESYRDMLAVLTAEGLRIRSNVVAAKEALAGCTNPLYRQLWERWLQRYPATALATK
jgi:thymidylate synthase